MILKIKIDCTPAIYFDTIKTILLTDSYADFGSKGGTGFSIFGPGRVVSKNAKRHTDNYFYLQNVKKAGYAVLYMETYMGTTLYTGHTREVDFSQTEGDTAEVIVCLKPNMMIITQAP